jgi:hypothetical protein
MELEEDQRQEITADHSLPPGKKKKGEGSRQKS